MAILTAARHHSPLAVAVALVLASAAAQAQVALPVPCATGACGPTGPNVLVTSGQAGVVQAGNAMTITQQTANATLNWQSFNIGAGGSVQFVQPDANSVALNRIFQADPARIFGSLNANGRVYLLNRNGIVFGQGAQVNVRGLLASTLDLSPEALELGLARASSLTAPALQQYVSGGQRLASGAVTVERGATITADGGQVLLFAPEVTNRGSISTPDGQTILGAGQRIFLAASDDPDLRGLLVEVGDGGTVTNGDPSGAAPDLAGVSGRITAERGNVTLAGIAVNQNGRVSATTSVRANGSIRLLARDTAATRLSQPGFLEPTRTGNLTLGTGSRTEVTLDADTATSVDVNVQRASEVELAGRNVSMLAGASIVAPGGNVTLTAGTSPLGLETVTGTPDNSRIYMAAGSRIDVSGATANLAMERNSLRVELRGSQLADSPVQRDGALRAGNPGLGGELTEAVYVDVRQSGTRADGTTWRGSPVGDLSADIATVARDVRERNLDGGNVQLISQGSVLLDDASTIDLSGGQINWASGYVRSSYVLGADGRAYNIAAADRDREYLGVLDGQRLQDRRWGTGEVYNLQGIDPRGQYEAGYVEGRDAGSLTIAAPRAVVGANIVGTVVAGVNQRLTTASSSSLHPLPRGPRLEFGLAGAFPAPTIDFGLAGVTFADGPGVDELRNADGSAFDPRRDPLPGSVSTLFLDPSRIAAAAPSSLAVYANGAVTLPAGATLQLARGGELLVRAGRIDLDGSVVAPGGAARLTARQTVTYTNATTALQPTLRMGAGARLALQGEWINDRLALQQGALQLSPAFTNGGTADLAAEDGLLDLAAGSVIDVSGGARRTAGGTVLAGSAGSIALSARLVNGTSAPELRLGSELRGYALQDGGTLSINAPAACISGLACTDPGALALAPALFGSGGFRSYAVTTTLGDLRVTGDVRLDLQSRNWLLSDRALTAATGTSMASLVTLGTLPEATRRPVNLSLSANQTINPFPEYGDLVVEAGATFDADPRAVLSFTSNSRVLFDGTVRAAGGTVNFGITPTLGIEGFLADQAIWLGNAARVDVSGRTVLDVRQDGRRTGTVLDGGTVNFDAARGYVLLQPGSVIDADGASDVLDLQLRDGRFEQQQVDSRGGTLRIATTEGLQIGGVVTARGGSATAAGGTLEVLIDNRRSNDPDGLLGLTARRVVVTSGGSPTVIAPGLPVPGSLNGVAALPAEMVAAGGFDFVSLAARDIIRPLNVIGPAVFSQGSIVLQSGVTLAPRARLVLDASSLQLPGAGPVSLSSAYVGLGSTDTLTQSVIPATPGDATLDIRAGLLDLVGQASVVGTRTVDVTATDGVRLQGVFRAGGTDYVGSTRLAGDVTINTSQLYASTLTQGTLAVTGGDLTLNAAGQASPILSAGSRLTLQADRIDVGTRVAAPGGTLTLRANEVQVRDGGALSVALEGTTLFGRLQGGFAWVYELPGGNTRVYDGTAATLPEKFVSIEADRLAVDAGAVIDVAGGGDLLAFEYVPGPGGTRDVLSAEVDSRNFAVVPGLSLPYAPVDPRESRGTTLRPGDSVWLEDAPGLAAGYYTLLPARYALLPGARLVTPVSGYQDLRPGDAVRLTDGTPVVSGYRTMAGTSIRDSRSSGFAIRDAAAVAELARYDVATANSFFPAQRGLADTRLPRDAGSVSLSVGSSLDVQGTVRTTPATGGRGAIVDVSATRLRVTGRPDDVLSGWVNVVDTQLRNLNADLLVLGGRRATGSGALTPVSTDFLLAAGASLSAPRLVMLANGTLTAEGGSTARATGATAALSGATTINGDAAVVYLDSRQGAGLNFAAGAARPAQLNLAAGAVLGVTPGGAITLAGNGAPQLDATLEARGAALRVRGDRLTLADDAEAAAAGVLRANQLAASGLTALDLEARSRLAIAGDVTATFGRFGVTAPLVVATRAGSNSRITADTITVAGPAGVPVASGGNSTLTLVGNSITFGGGAVGFAGYGQVDLQSNSPLALAGSGTLSAGGDLAVRGGFAATRAGADVSFTANGALDVTAAPGALAANTSALGTRLRLVGDTVAIAAPVYLSSGELDVAAASGVRFTGDALVDLAAREFVVDGLPLALPGGVLRATATTGDVAVEAGARLRLDGASGGNGGRLELAATQGVVTLAGTASAAGGRGGELAVDARNAGFADLVRVAGNGFTGAVQVRQRGPGDLVLGAGQTLAARDVLLAAEGGALTVDGSIVAAASDGHVVLVARDLLQVNGTLSAGGAAALDDPGLGRASVLLASEAGVRVDAGATVDLHGGELRVRLPEAVVLGAVGGGNGLRLDGTLANTAGVAVEGYRRYAGLTNIGAADVAASTANARYAAAVAFIDATQGRGAALGLADGQAVRFTPGLDLVADGDLQLDADWNLSDWNHQGVAPTITLRAAGDLNLEGSLSDGFASLAPDDAGFNLPATARDSATLRLVAGADTGAADPLALRPASNGSLRIGEGLPFDGFNPGIPRMVRTGTGSIDIAASGNLVLANQASVIYTAGVRGAGIELDSPQSAGGLGGLGYPERGGDIRIAVGRDIIGAPSTQLFTDWLLRTGSRASDTIAPRPTAWSVAFQNFEQGIGALGGGTVTVAAGGAIRDLSVALPSIGRQVGGTTVAENRVVETGGGALRVRAGGDIVGGTYYVGRGNGTLVAGGSIDSADPTSLFSLAPLLAVGSGGISVQARQQVAIETIVNPTLLGQSRLLGDPLPSYFSTYTDASRATLTSVGRSVRLGTDTTTSSPLAAQYPLVLFSDDAAARTLPPSLRVVAPSDSIQVGGSITLWPAPRGELTLVAGRDVNFAPRFGGAIEVIMSDAAVGRDLPTPDRPSEDFTFASSLLGSAYNSSPNFYAPTPVHGATDTMAADPEPVRIIALAGDVSFQANSPSTFSTLFMPKRVRVLAGRDIVSLGLRAQHVAPGDVTTIRAGRDITYPLVRTSTGQVSTSVREVTVGGGGELQLIAGRDIDLQTSRGITTEGALRNPALGSAGANISLVAGEAGGAPDFEAFIDTYLAGSTQYDTLLGDYLRRLDGSVPATKEGLLARFRALDPDTQRPLLRRILSNEILLGGRVAAGSPERDYSRAFRALETYYPGSNPDLEAGETNPYAGDIRLYFSRAYTLAGGGVSMIAPGGEVNVGLAAPPTAFGIRKAPAELGVVAQGVGDVVSISYGNFQVNESRAISGDGGNILVWSTQGDIDAGRGAKTAISAPPPQITIDEQGQPRIVFPAAFTGSGIQTLATTPDRRPGNVDLFAPRGVVNAGDAGIVAGNLTIAATAVLGAGNISVSGTAVGVPVDTGGLGASLAGASNSATGASNAGADLAGQGGKDSTSNTPLADTALNWLDVFVVGLGDETCRPDDLECLKRQRTP